MEINNKYTLIIGLEIHVELTTKSKMFCQCSADYFGEEPNTHTCPVCLGMPGGLPVPNAEAIRRTMLIGKALGCKINNKFKFDRKHYFYPDLPKGYQISQYDEPIATDGKVTILRNGEYKDFRITRVHLEEDTGKLTHSGSTTKIDFNRGGVPLVEIVTEPDFHDPEDVKAFLHELQVIIRYLGVANADMEKGDMRLEPNISLQLTKNLPKLPPYKVEVKNINSFNFVKKAIEFEYERHLEILEAGKYPQQETRGYNSANGTTVSQRVKEQAEDYRYFPEPDIPPFEFSDKELEDILKDMPEMPIERVKRYIEKLHLKEVDALIITRDRSMAEFFEKVLEGYEKKATDKKDSGQIVANYLINKKILSDSKVEKIVDEILSSSKPKATDTGLLSSVIEKILKDNQKAVDDFKSGKNPNAVMFLVGQVMREMKGQADAQIVKTELEKVLQ